MSLAQIDPFNPLLPIGPDILLAALVVPLAALALALPLWAAVTLWRSRYGMETTHLLIWMAVIILAPFVGSLVWLFFGRVFHGVDGGQDLQSAQKSLVSPRIRP